MPTRIATTRRSNGTSSPPRRLSSSPPLSRPSPPQPSPPQTQRQHDPTAEPTNMELFIVFLLAILGLVVEFERHRARKS
jgi:hypothetical protein